jgi:hypothetical protein
MQSVDLLLFFWQISKEQDRKLLKLLCFFYWSWLRGPATDTTVLDLCADHSLAFRRKLWCEFRVLAVEQRANWCVPPRLYIEGGAGVFRAESVKVVGSSLAISQAKFSSNVAS